MYKLILNQVASLSDQEKLKLSEFLISSVRKNIVSTIDSEISNETVVNSSENIESEELSFNAPPVYVETEMEKKLNERLKEMAETLQKTTF